MKKQRTDIVVIGGGAAGMLAAAIAGERGKSVVLLEPNDVFGKKLRITGKGRCNVTNNCDLRETMENIPRNGKFLYSAFSAFGTADTIELFESLGVKLKTERGNRVFPQSDRAGDIAAALIRYMSKSGVETVRTKALEILQEDGHITGVKTGMGVIACEKVILCTGGCSYPGTGSTGDGYRMAEKLGHSIIEPKASLVPLEAEECCARMQGLSLRNVAIKVFNKKDKKIYEDFGEMLFTHFGVSGPLILSASAHMRDFASDKYYIMIDLKPALDEKKLDERILRDFEKYSNKDFKNALDDLLSKMMIPVVIERSGILPETKVHSITKQQRRALVELIKNFRIDIYAPRSISEAIITSGGVNVKEIIPATMESKIVKNLFFAGEVIDVDAYTGGFNLQIAWSTAAAAGRAAAKEEENEL